jgi:probable rRNA maturation factor
MIYETHIHCDVDLKDDFSWLSTVAEDVLRHEQAPSGDLTLVLTDESAIRKLNHQFRGQNAPTDVLAFADGDLDPDTGKVYYGDVIIALPVARNQALTSGQTLEAELTMLTIHGVLHLLGYDDSEPDKRAKMWGVKRTIVEKLGYQISLPEDTA